jgi:ferrous iron transport protein B
MATMTTRILETRRQRIIAILLLTVAVPCSAQLGVISAVLAAISAAGLLIYVAVILVVFFAVGWAAAKVMPGDPADLLLEVPPFRWPRLTNVLVKTYHRVKWFMREAVPLFLIGTACFFVADKTGLLGVIEAVARPVVTGLLGLPAAATIGFILGFLRRDYGTVIIFEQFKQGQIGANQTLVALVVITLFVPCLAHFFVCVKELGWRKALLMDAFVLVLAVLVGAAVRLLLAATGIDVTATP